MTEEIFGPILPVLTYKNFDEVVSFINSREKPLALYYFGSDKANKDRLEKETSSGALSFNDAAFHLLNPYLPFGGVGTSGQGAYHGVSGFKTCSHPKPIFDKSTINFFPFNQRYPPFPKAK
jgi:acyl-CoA reductase-like NAD-dependent aldehyde dehydrogenase